MIDLNELIAEVQEAASPIGTIIGAGFGLIGTVSTGVFGYLAVKKGQQVGQVEKQKADVEHERDSERERAEGLAVENRQARIDLAGVSLRRGDRENLPELNLRILVIEDTPADRWLAKVQLKDSSFIGSVEDVESIDQAAVYLGRAKALDEPFDLILLDPGLGSTDGMESVKQTLEIAEGIPVLVLTGRVGDTQFGSDCLRQGAKAYMTKDQLLLADDLDRSVLFAIRTPRKRG